MLGSISVKSGVPLFRITFTVNKMDEFSNPDLLLLSPSYKIYRFESFDFLDEGDEYGTDEEGNRYTGFWVNPEMMEIVNPEAGVWLVGARPSPQKDTTYLLESNMPFTNPYDEYDEEGFVSLEFAQAKVEAAVADPTYKKIYAAMDAISWLDESKYSSDIEELNSRLDVVSDPFFEVFLDTVERLDEMVDRVIFSSPSGTGVDGKGYTIQLDGTKASEVTSGEEFILYSMNEELSEIWDEIYYFNEGVQKLRKGDIWQRDVSIKILEDAITKLDDAINEFKDAVQTGTKE